MLTTFRKLATIMRVYISSCMRQIQRRFFGFEEEEIQKFSRLFWLVYFFKQVKKMSHSEEGNLLERERMWRGGSDSTCHAASPGHIPSEANKSVLHLKMSF